MLAEEERRGELAARAGAGLLEDRLQVVGDGVRRDRQPLGGLHRRSAPQHKLGHLLLARGEAVGLEQQRCDECRVRALDEHGDVPGAGWAHEPAVEDQPGACRSLDDAARKRRRA